MTANLFNLVLRTSLRSALAACGFALLVMAVPGADAALAVDAPVPLLEKGKKVDWWFAYKFNTKAFRGCGEGSGTRTCPYGNKINTKVGANFSQQYVFASKTDGTLAKGKGCLGMTMNDPVGATFDEIYNGSPFFLIWNDQFYGDPKIEGCGKGNCNSPWGHSKGMLAWNDAGEGLVLQVTTPSWPAAGSSKHPRKAGNTLGCISTQNNLNNAQHFFALKLNKDGVVAVLEALKNASVATDPANAQIARLGGPSEIRERAEQLGEKPKRKPAKSKGPEDMKIIQTRLASDVMLISKPSNLNVPPWQMVSALLDSASERTATWWASPRIFSTKKSTKIGCWEGVLKSDNKKPGDVVIAKTGNWQGKEIGLIGGQNHAKVGVTTSGSKHYVIFGDLNQQGSINPVKGKCDKSQNGRGGLFFVVENDALFKTLTEMLDGKDEPFKSK
jgi:Deoxyribonuclease II